MTIPFRSFAIDEAGMAAYLRLVRDSPTSYHGAILVVNSIGEPVEFCHAELSPPASALWRASDERRRCSGALARAMFEVCQSQPRIVFGLASELEPGFFRTEVQPVIAACRVVPGTGDHLDEGELATAAGPRLVWAGEKPDPGSPERYLLNRLIDNDLLEEPFERALAGLREAVAEQRHDA
ncbi:MAG: hypothetical protein ACLQGJ_02565 [Candidatus Dormibacteria bacterium]